MFKRYKTFSAVVLYCLFVVFLLAGCSNQPRDAGMTPSDIHDEGVVAPEDLTEQEIAFDNDTMNKEELIVYDSLYEIFGASYSIHFDASTRTYSILPIDGEMESMVEFIMDGKLHFEWKEMLYSFEVYGQRAREVVGPGYTINMLNPHNNDRLLFSIHDGVLVYDFSNDYS